MGLSPWNGKQEKHRAVKRRQPRSMQRLLLPLHGLDFVYTGFPQIILGATCGRRSAVNHKTAGGTTPFCFLNASWTGTRRTTRSSNRMELRHLTPSRAGSRWCYQSRRRVGMARQNYTTVCVFRRLSRRAPNTAKPIHIAT